MRPPCIGAILDTVKSWIGTGTASPASSSKVPSRSAVSSGGGARVSQAPCASFTTSRRCERRTNDVRVCVVERVLHKVNVSGGRPVRT